MQATTWFPSRKRRSVATASIVFGSLLLLASIGIAVGWHISGRSEESLTTQDSFELHDLGVSHELFDMGTVNFNEDRWMDIYTVNHYARSKLFVNDGSGAFADQFLSSGLDSNPGFPGLEPGFDPPSVDAKGLYLYWHFADFVVLFHRVESKGGMTVLLTVPKTAFPETAGAINVSINDEGENRQIRIVAHGDGHVRLKSTFYLSYPSIHLDEELDLEQVYVGSRAVNPQAHQFRLWLRDRHGHAWTDLNNDGRNDLFIARGGAVGRMRPGSVDDKYELLWSQGPDFVDVFEESGLVKNACSAQGANWIDFDADGLLDLYVVCGRDSPPRQHQPNQLHRQISPGIFSDVAQSTGLDVPEKGIAGWLDADGDGDQDMLWADEREFRLYENRPQGFEPHPLGTSPGMVQQFTLADFDRDGDTDVFAVSPARNVILINEEGRFSVRDGTSFGLPRAATTANWVDVDNDGRVDLHAVPGGIYRQHEDGSFEATGLLASAGLGYGRRTFGTWFDADNDGRRDLAIGLPRTGRGRILAYWMFRWLPKSVREFVKRNRPHGADVYVLHKWDIELYLNRLPSGHWLQVDLVGSQGNRSAIGATAELHTKDGMQFQQVGHAEGAFSSQGHLRMYFGLGDEEQVTSLVITWPDGTEQEIGPLQADRLYTARYPVPSS